jgi:archaellum component FlaC
MEPPAEIDKLRNDIKKMSDKIELLNKEISTICDEMNRNIIEEKIIDIETQLENAKIKQTDLQQLHDLQSSCCHEFVEDLVDLTPDKSIAVQYCIYCYYTAP